MFGGNQNLISLATGVQPIANDLFTVALRFGCEWIYRIHLSGVKDINSCVQCHVHLGKGILLCRLRTKGHCTQTQIRDHNTRTA